MTSATTSRRLRRAIAGTALALAVASITGCGGGDDKTAPPSGDAGTTTAAAPAAPGEGDATDSEQGGDRGDDTGDEGDGTDQNDGADHGDDGGKGGKGGAEQQPSDDPELQPFLDAYAAAIKQATTAHMRVRVTDAATANLDVAGLADFKAAPPLFEIVIKDPKDAANTARYLVAGSDMYIQIPGTDQYYLVDASQNPLGASGGSIIDPEAMVEQLRGGITDVTDEGLTTEDGVRVRHYVVLVDTATLMDEAGADPNSTKLPKTLAYNIYLDTRGRLHGITADLGKTVGTFNVTYTRWGEPVDIKIPTGKQIYQPGDGDN